MVSLLALLLLSGTDAPAAHVPATGARVAAVARVRILRPVAVERGPKGAPVVAGDTARNQRAAQQHRRADGTIVTSFY